jgi:hypothetical protein
MQHLTVGLQEGLGKGYRLRIWIGFGFLLAGWIVVILNIFLGCRPFNHYWQINPNPGSMSHMVSFPRAVKFPEQMMSLTMFFMQMSASLPSPTTSSGSATPST